jgi:DnaJ-domain-containing protein 1
VSKLLLLVVLVLVVWRILRTHLLPPTAPAPRADAWDPWAVLGVPRTATKEAIAEAYRAQLKRYHPDRVADLGPELQRVAHEKTLELQRAFDAIGR